MSISIKNTAFSVHILTIDVQDIQLIKQQLRKKIDPAPMMFVGMKTIVDLSPIEGSELTIDLAELKLIIEKLGLVIVAIMTESKIIRKKAKEAELNTMRSISDALSNAQFSAKSASDTSSQALTKAPTIKKPELKNNNMIIKQPVRSGQRIYSQGDLTIIGQVSPGAEVIADGNIHIYGKLLGKAIAGAQGREDAMIFCQHFNAELVSIAGSYKQFSESDSSYQSKSVQISLNDEKIAFFSL